MIIAKGEKVHIIMRRAFEEDLRRHFIGEIINLNSYVIRVKGYSFVFDKLTNNFVKKPDKREKLVSLINDNTIINIIPSDANLEKTIYTINKEKHLCVTDGETFSLDINEFGLTR
ncbi:MAG: hypothetical protein U0457_19980 [Candidatus Sericytochromatia bacterium]